MGAAAAIIIRKEKEIVALYRSAGATSPGRGKTPASLGIHDVVPLHRLRGRMILREAGDGALYLDEPVWEAFRAGRRRLIITLMAIVLGLALAFRYLGVH